MKYIKKTLTDAVGNIIHIYENIYTHAYTHKHMHTHPS